MRLAITGGTGFVGSHLIDAALAAGHMVKALTRREQPPRDRVDMGRRRPRRPRRARAAGRPTPTRSSTSPASSTPRRGRLRAGQCRRARWRCWPPRPPAASTASSTSPRSPRASRSCRSTARPRRARRSWSTRSGLDWAIVRPPAVYGPGDKETLELFRMAKLGLMLMPPKGRLSVHPRRRPRPPAARACRAGGTVELLDRARRRHAGRLDPPRVRAARSARRSARGRRSSRRRPVPAARRPRRPAAPRRQGQADGRPRRLFLPPQLGRRPGAGAAAQCGGRRSKRSRAEGDSRLVSPKGWL